MTVRNPLTVDAGSGIKEATTEKYYRFRRRDTNNIYATWLKRYPIYGPYVNGSYSVRVGGIFGTYRRIYTYGLRINGYQYVYANPNDSLYREKTQVTQDYLAGAGSSPTFIDPRQLYTTVQGKEFFPVTNWKQIPAGAQPSRYRDNINIAGDYEEYDQVVSERVAEIRYTSVGGATPLLGNTRGIHDTIYRLWTKQFYYRQNLYTQKDYNGTALITYGGDDWFLGINSLYNQPPLIAPSNSNIDQNIYIAGLNYGRPNQLTEGKWYNGEDLEGNLINTWPTYNNAAEAENYYVESLGYTIDTRYAPGGMVTRPGVFYSASATPNITQVSVNNQRWLAVYYPTHPDPGWPTGCPRPAYINSDGELQQMTNADIDDTFVKPFIRDYLPEIGSAFTSSGYYISSSFNQGGNVYAATLNPSSRSLYNYIDSTTVLTDTRFVPGIYESDIPTDGITTTVNQYYIKLLDPASTTSSRTLIGINTDGSLVEDNGLETRSYTNFLDTSSVTGSMYFGILNRVNYYLHAIEGYRLRFKLQNENPSSSIEGVISENYGGSIISDTRLDGSASYQRRRVASDDYRTQKFPTGSSSIAQSWKLWSYFY